MGANLKGFVETINRCCRNAYQQFSRYLDDVLTLPVDPDEFQIAAVVAKLREASDSSWFHDVLRICDDLAAVADTYNDQIRAQIDLGRADNDGPVLSSKWLSLSDLLALLHRYESDLSVDFRRALDGLKVDLSTGDVGRARAHALAIKDTISVCLTRINGVAVQITGSSGDGANDVLTKEQIAANALRRPERILFFNIATVVVLLVVGATALQFVTIVAFPILTGFVLASVVIVNAFYLRSIDKLREESFIQLVRLALLNFLAPLSKNSRTGY